MNANCPSNDRNLRPHDGEVCRLVTELVRALPSIALGTDRPAHDARSRAAEFAAALAARRTH
ncbi:MAG: hypothetical protein HYV17_01545 [Xanthomonadales bacterium]|nr:hypothetical protein [Xanthomonadales bacterium]